ncbi:MAG: histidine kinase [Clostridia bacterium]|nr:histidine kinase [Clostridia bacterium]
MKMYKNKWLLSLKGIKNIILIMLLIISTFAVSIIILENNLNNSRIQGICQQENKRLQTAFEKEINKSADLARYFTVTQISSLPENFTPEQYEDYYEALRQISSVSAVSDQVVSVILRYGDNYIEYGNETSVQDYKALEKPDFEYEYNKNTKLLFLNKKSGYIYLRYAPKTITAGANEVFLKINLGSLSENCIQNSGEDERNYVLLSNGTVIISSSYNHIGKRFNDLYDKKASELSEEVIKIFDTENKKWYSSSSSHNGITVLNLTSQEYYKEYTNNGILVGFLFCAFFLILVMMFFILFYSSFIKPIGKILETIDTDVLEKKDYDYDVMNYIKSNIAGLYSQNSNLTEKISKTLEELKAQQIIACQMQINPHFLSNTLSAINWIAVEKFNDIDNPISNSLSALSDIFYSTLAADEIIVTVEKEKADTEKYIEILKMRYGSDLDVEWQIDENLKNEYILKTSIQPLIENCAGYAFVSTEKDKKITISIEQTEEDILISVKDNGIGIEPEKLNLLKQSINDFETPIKKHIGLKNINRRIKLLYGEDYGLDIESVPGEYTLSYFRYPKK